MFETTCNESSNKGEDDYGKLFMHRCCLHVIDTLVLFRGCSFIVGFLLCDLREPGLGGSGRALYIDASNYEIVMIFGHILPCFPFHIRRAFHHEDMLFQPKGSCTRTRDLGVFRTSIYPSSKAESRSKRPAPIVRPAAHSHHFTSDA